MDEDNALPKHKNNYQEKSTPTIDEDKKISFKNNDAEIAKIKQLIPKRLDALPYSRFHTLVICALGITWILDGYEVSLLSVLSGVLKITFSMSDTEIGFAGSLYLLGCVIGSLVFGFFAAKWGRKMLFTVTLGIYIISILFTAISINKYMFFFCRMLTGISVGGEYSAIFAAIDELIPPSIRGRADLIIDGTWHFGSAMAASLAFLSLTYLANYQEMVIRMLFILGVLLAFPVIYLRRYIPESPRWLVYRGQYRDALNILDNIERKYKPNNLESYYSEDNTNLINFTLKNKDIPNEKQREITFKEIIHVLFIKHRIRFFYGLILMSSQAFFYNGIFYTYTLILQKFYFVSKESVGLFLIPLSVASFLGPLLLGKYFDSWSRRRMIAITFCLSGLLLIVTAVNFISNTFPFWAQQIIWFFTFFVASPAASSAHLTVSEIFPLEMRSQAMAIFFSFGLLIGGVLSPLLFGMLIDKDDKGSIFFSYLLAACIMIFAGIFGWFNGIDAENKSLEQISKNMLDDEEEEEEQQEKTIDI